MRRSRRLLDGASNALAALLLVLLVGVFMRAAAAIWLRARYPYDLLYWPDDYFLSMVLRIARGDAAYSPVSEANAWIYSPGGPYLHALLLKPLGLITSFRAHKVLAMVWLYLGIFASWKASMALLRTGTEAQDSVVTNWCRGLTLLLIVSLASFTNPIAESLHPTNLELGVLGATTWACVRWPELTDKQRVVLALSLPALALFFKQTGGVAVTASLVIVNVMAGRAGWRYALIAAASAGGMLALLTATGGEFWTWAWRVPSAAPFKWWKLEDLAIGAGLLSVPVLLLAVTRATIAIRLRGDGDRAWLRGALPALPYTPLAILALVKALGGPNNLHVVLLLWTVVTAPLLVSSLFAKRRLASVSASVALALLSLTVWLPNKRVPTAADYAHGEALCGYVHARMRCGERVLLPRGAACYLEGWPDVVPKDRAMSVMDLHFSAQQTATLERLRSGHYDVVIMTKGDLSSPWLGPPYLTALWQSYKPFGRLPGGQTGNLWTEGTGDLNGPVALYQRRNEAATRTVQGDMVGCRR